MSWFSALGRRGATAGGGRAAPAAPADPGGPEVHRSLAFASLLETLGKQSRLQVLDLGPAVGGNVEFLSRFGCKLYIEDFYAALAARAASSELDLDGTRAGRLFAELLPFPPDTTFDAVLAWDLFNYLERREVGALALYIARFCRPGAVLFALVSILKQIPAQPFRFRILDSERLAYESQSSASRPSPRYAPAELNELLRDFRLDRSFLMRHGIQEYLFTRTAG